MSTKRGGFDVPILIRSIVRHLHVTLADGLPFDTTEMDSLVLRVVLDDLEDGESVYRAKMFVATVPDSTSTLMPISMSKWSAGQWVASKLTPR